jgi:hypothetical protein
MSITTPKFSRKPSKPWSLNPCSYVGSLREIVAWMVA